MPRTFSMPKSNVSTPLQLQSKKIEVVSIGDLPEHFENIKLLGDFFGPQLKDGVSVSVSGGIASVRSKPNSTLIAQYKLHTEGNHWVKETVK